MKHIAVIVYNYYESTYLKSAFCKNWSICIDSTIYIDYG